MAYIPDNEEERKEFLQRMSEAISGETAAEGDDSGWVMIGALKLGVPITIKSPDGVPLLELSIRSLNAVQDFDPQGNYAVLLKRNDAGELERIGVSFTTSLPYSNQLPADHQKLMDAMVRLGVMKKK